MMHAEECPNQQSGTITPHLELEFKQHGILFQLWKLPWGGRCAVPRDSSLNDWEPFSKACVLAEC